MMKSKKVLSYVGGPLLTVAAGVFSMGLSDEDGARETLDNAGYDIIRYDGHDFLHRDAKHVFSDRFRVADSLGKEREVVVTKTLGGETTIRGIPALSRDMDKPAKKPYNPFKIPTP